MSSNAAHAPAADHTAATAHSMAQVGHEVHHHHHHHHHHHDEAAPKPSWSIHPGRPKKAQHHKHAPPPYTDDPNTPAPAVIYADASDAEAQSPRLRPHVLRDVLVVVFQLLLLLAMGLVAYRWYTDFNAHWQATHADQIAAEIQRREHILTARALQDGNNS